MPENIFLKVFHYRVLLRWDVLGSALALFPTVGGVLIFFDQYTYANICFVITFVLALAKIAQISISSNDYWWRRMLFTFLMFGSIGLAAVESVRGVNRFAAKKRQQSDQTPIQANISYPPACYISPAGQIINGVAPMMIANQTEVPVDDVDLNIVQVYSQPPDGRPSALAWTKAITIGTCKAKLTTSLPEQFPIDGHRSSRFDIVMTTRLETFRETIEFEKQDAGYTAHMSFYKAGVMIYEDSQNLTVTNIPGVSPPLSVETAHGLSLRFIYPTSPALEIINYSDTVLRDMKWYVALWNTNLPERNDPLPIPVSTFDWLRPHTKSGPQGLFGSQPVASLIKPGDVLVGSASVSCPECTRGRTYLIYIVWGQGGWFSEVEGTDGASIIPKSFTKESRDAYVTYISAVPSTSRMAIENR